MTSPRILWLHRQRSAVGSYRCLVPARWLQAKGYDITFFEEPYNRALQPNMEAWFSQHLGKFDLLIVDRAVEWGELPLFSGFRHASPGMRMIVDFDDDWTNVPWWNISHASYKPGLANYESGKAHLKLSELTTVSTGQLAKVFTKFAHDISVVPNGIDLAEWHNLPTNAERGEDPYLRVLYGGANGHFGDLDDARAGLETVIESPPVPFRLICFGALPVWLHEAAKRYPSRVVRLPWVPFEDYPAAIAYGGFDFAIAPLAVHKFNSSKSNIKFLEAAAQGFPLLCSDVGPFSELPPDAVVRVSNTPVQWTEGFKHLLIDASFRVRVASRALEVVKDQWTIEKTGLKWEQAIEKAMSLSPILSLEDTRLLHEKV